MLKCSHCGQEKMSKRSRAAHELRCPSNPNRIVMNQYIKGTGYSVSDEARAKMSAKATGRKHTDATRQKLSIIRKTYIDEHPDQVPYLLNHSSKISYPEQYFRECFASMNDVTVEHRVGRYSLDFANVGEKLYLEIDGEQHYSDPRIVEHDIRRTESLELLGWRGIRVRWSEYQQLTDTERKNKIQEIGSVMKWLS